MIESLTTRLLSKCQKVEEITLHLVEELSSMSAQEIERHVKDHNQLHKSIQTLTEKIDPSSLNTSDEKSAFSQSCEILERVLTHNEKIIKIARNTQALFSKEMHSINSGRTALSGYNQAYNKIDQVKKSKGRLIRKAG